jgi:hypothetical protein
MMRGVFAMLLVVSATSLAAQELPERYVRADVGHAVEVPWLGVRAGWTADEGTVGLDLGLAGSPEGRGFLALTGGLEGRIEPQGRVSPFGRLEIGAMAQSRGAAYGVVGLGGGLAIRLHPSWALRTGFMYSLHLGDSIHGPDFFFAGLERRW